MAKRPKSPARAAVETCRALAGDPEALRAYMSLLPPSVMDHIEILVPAADAVFNRLCHRLEDGENLFIHWRENGVHEASFTASFDHAFAERSWPRPRDLRGVLDDRGNYQVPDRALPSVKRRRPRV